MRTRFTAVALRSGAAATSLVSSFPQRATFSTTRVVLADDGGGAFERYSEIDNSNERKIKALRSFKMCEKDDEWIGTEKVHGANFGVYSLDYGSKIRYSKRSGLMPDAEHFFGYHCLIPELVSCIRKVRELLEAKLTADAGGKEPVKVHTVIVNGELFGGKYEHPSVPKSTQTFTMRGKTRGINCVQNDQFPQYSPNLHFYAFDIKYRVAPPAPAPATSTTDSASPAAAAVADGEAGSETLPYDDAVAIFEQVPKLLYAKAIVRGTMDEVAAFDVETFQTTLPALLGLGDYPLKGNWSEGLVVRHAKRGTIGWAPKGPTILKFKSVAFQEISTDKSAGPRSDAMADVRRESIARAGVQLPRLTTVIQNKDELEAAEFLLQHVCDNRLKNVLSKLGPSPFIKEEVTHDDLAKMLAHDSLKDFLKECEPAIINSSMHTRETFARYCLFESRKLVCAQWSSILSTMKAQADEEAAQDAADGDAPMEATTSS